MKLIRELFRVASANGIQVLSGVVLGFMLPKYLSLNQYANYKTYMLIVFFIDFINFGFPDGLYVSYGGRGLETLDKSQLKSEHSFFFKLEIGLCLITLLVGFFTQSQMLMLIGASIFPYNLNTFYKRIYQSTDRLSWYSNIVISLSLFNSIICLIMLFVFSLRSAWVYCAISIVAQVIVNFKENYRLRKWWKNQEISYNFHRYATIIRSGFIIMVGNIAVNLFLGIDRWFVRIFFDTHQFSYYSFAVSMLNIATTIFQAISMSMFGFLAKSRTSENLRHLKDIIMVLGTFSSIAYFPLAIIVKNYLPVYIPSLDIVSITMAIFPFLLYINTITINLYKLENRGRRYLTVMLVMLLGIIIVDCLVVPFHDSRLIASATLICYFVWYLYSRFDTHDGSRISFKEVIYLVIMTGSYLVTSHGNAFVGGLVYIGLWIAFTFCYVGVEGIKNVYRNIYRH